MGSIEAGLDMAGQDGALRQQLRLMVAKALEIEPRRLRGGQSWLAHGGASLTAINLMGSCYEAGIDVDIADIITTETIDELIERIVTSHRHKRRDEDCTAQPESNGGDGVDLALNGSRTDQHLHPNGHKPGSNGDTTQRDGRIQANSPCSPMQENFLATQAIDPAAYVLRISSRIRSLNSNIRLTTDLVAAAWRQVAARHVALRTTFSGSIDRPGHHDQLVWKLADPPISCLSLQEAENLHETPEFGSRLPHRLILAQIGGDEVFIKLVISHAVVDGVSMQIILRDLSLALKSLLPSTEPLQCSDYFAAQQPDASSEAGLYWANYTAAAESTFLNQDIQSSQTELYSVASSFPISPDAATSFSRQSNATLVNACQVAWALVLRSYTHSSNTTFSYITSGRQRPIAGLQDAVGNFVNTLPCCVNLERTPMIAEALAQAQRDYLSSLRYQAADLTNTRDAHGPSVRRLGDTVMSFTNSLPATELAKAGLAIDNLSWVAPTDYNYSLSVSIGSQGLDLTLHVWESITSRERASALMQLFVDALGFVVNGLGKSHLEFWGLTVQEQGQIVARSANLPPAMSTCVHDLVRESVAQTPHAQAVCAWDGDLTYQELDSWANNLADSLHDLGIETGTTVGLCMDKSRFAVVALLGILYAGCTVVPIGVQFPLARISSLVVNSGLVAACVDERQADRLADIVPRPVLVDAALLNNTKPQRRSYNQASPEDPAYVIYTSGSTGKPKGVVLQHEALSTGIRAHGSRLGSSSRSRTLQFAAHSFDISISDVFTTLSFGGCVCVPSEEQRLDPEKLTFAINDMGVNSLNITATVAMLLDPTQVPLVSTIVLAGEAVRPAVIERWQGHTQLFNAYGPAECSIYSAINGPILRPEDAPVIGSAVANALWVTDPDNYNRLCPIGVEGELLIEGPILAREYLHAPEATAASFVMDPDFVSVLGSRGRRMYRTGDMVRQRDDGSLVYLGRRDTQVKLRGQRLELGEIESQLLSSSPSVQAVCVDLVQPDWPSAQPLLLAALEVRSTAGHEVLASGNLIEPSIALSAQLQDLKSSLLDVLPLYMVPSFFVPMSKLPLNASYKLDRRAIRSLLSCMSQDELDSYQPTADASPVVTATEKGLQVAWAEALGRAETAIGSNSHFFELGGDSVVAMRLASIGRRLGLDLSVSRILQLPRLSDLARAIDGADKDASTTSTPDPPPYELWPGFASLNEDERSSRLRTIAASCSVPAREIEDVYPCSDFQEGLMAMTSQHYELYVAQQVFRLEPRLDLKRFQQAWGLLASTLAIFRTRIVYTADGNCVQVVTRNAQPWNSSSDMETFLEQDRRASFGYGVALHRFAIIANENGDTQYFVWTAHHAGYDGWSMLKMFKLLGQAYQDSTCAPVTPIPRFIQHLYDSSRTEKMEKADAYWRRELQDVALTPFPDLVGSAYRPSVNSVVKKKFQHPRNSHVSQATILKAAWALVVASQTSSEEAISLHVFSGRDIPVADIEDAVFPTINTVPFRAHIDSQQTVSDFLAAIDRQSREMTQYAHMGFHRIRQTIPGLAAFDPGHLFLINPSILRDDAVTAELIGMLRHPTATQYSEGYALVVDCTLDLNESTSTIEVRFDDKVLPLCRTESIIAQFEHITHQLQLHCQPSRNPNGAAANIRIGGLDLISLVEKERLVAWNPSPQEATCTCLHEVIQKVTQSQPHSLAIDAWDGKLTYSQLDAAAEKLASFLSVSLKVKPESLVAVCMDKSKYAVIASMAILKAGGVVVPLGVQDTTARIRTIIANAKIDIAIVDSKQEERFNTLVSEAIVVDEAALDSLPTPPAPMVQPAKPDNAALIIYTSGSTGTPKGVVLEHQALCTGILAQSSCFGISNSTRALQFSAYTFDVAWQDIFVTLFEGGCVCIPSETARLNDLASSMRNFEVTYAALTPTVASMLDPLDLPALETLVLTGEAANPSTIRPWINRGLRIFNAYGPAESTIHAAIGGPIASVQDALNIGHGVGTRLWVVQPSDYHRLCPVGAPGELLIEGPLLAREYFGDPVKTIQAFIFDPSFLASLGIHSSHTRMYRTGDIVRQNPVDGSLTYLGRYDTQIKIRGQRVEVGEIEEHIVQCQPAAYEACADLIQDESGNAVLVAALRVDSSLLDDNIEVSERDGVLPETICHASDSVRAMLSQTRDALQQRLPRHMLPAHLIPLRTFPRNASGKLDRRATRTLIQSLNSQQLSTFTTGPHVDAREMTATERHIAVLWADVLGHADVSDIRPDTNFLHLGGDSVTAMRMVAVAKTKQLQLGVADVLQNPILQDMARIADSNDLESLVSKHDPAPFELCPWLAAGDQVEHNVALAEVAEQCGVLPEAIEDLYPCTPLQEALMAVTQQTNDAYMVQRVFQLDSQVDFVRLRGAWAKLTNDLPILRTRIVFSKQSSNSLQAVLHGDLQWTEAPDLPTYLAADRSVRFSYGTPLHRFAYIAPSAQTSGQSNGSFVWTAHHSGYDGWSMHQLLKRLKDVYQGLETDPVVSMPRFLQYLHNAKDKSTAYWQRELDGLQAGRFPSLPHPSYRPKATEVLRRRFECARSSTNGAQVPVALRAAWAVAVATFTGSEEALTAFALSGREAPVRGIESLIAPTITTVPVRVRLDRTASIADFLTSVDHQAKEMMSHSHSGMLDIRNIAGLDAEFDPGHLMVIQPAGVETDGLEDIGIKAQDVENVNFTGYALSVACSIMDNNNVDVEVQYDDNVLTSDKITSLLDLFEQVVWQLRADNTAKTVGRLGLISNADRDKLAQWNNLVPESSNECVHELVKKTVDRQPQAPAVCAWDGELTFAQLDSAASRLAYHLRQLGVGTRNETSVGLVMSKSCWATVSLYAILKAGGVVVPLGIKHPLARIETIINDAKIDILLVDQAQHERLRDMTPIAIVVNQVLLEHLPIHLPSPISVSPTAAAWIVYTSGSTGVPKGVVLQHDSLCTSMKAHGAWFSFSPTTRTLSFAATTFDAYIVDTCTTWYFGGCCCIPSEAQCLGDLTRSMRSMCVTFAGITSTVASLIEPEEVPTMKTMVLSGEPLRADVVKNWLPYTDVINCYGPTEASINWACGEPMTDVRQTSIIGRPLCGNAWVVDPFDPNRLTPIGAPGELLLEGPLLARGYLNDLQKTNSSFITDPVFVNTLGLSPGRRLYRTGDLVIQGQHGDLIYLGRRDTQIKVRGQRIEIGEIESRITQAQEEIRYASVDLIRPEGSSNDPVLMAAVELHDGFVSDDIEESQNEPLPTYIAPPSRYFQNMIQKLRGDLLQNLPMYMVPSYFIPVSRLPTTISSKLDRRAMRASLERLTQLQLRAFNYKPPTKAQILSVSENKLRSIWAEVLNFPAEEIGVDDHFLQLGGDSVTAMRLVALAMKQDIRIGVADVIQYPRLGDLANIVDSYSAVAAHTAAKDPAPFGLIKVVMESQNDIHIAEVAMKCGVKESEIIDIYPCTTMQEGLMAISAQQPRAYRMERIFDLGEQIDYERLKASWMAVIDAFAILRTRIINLGAYGPFQVVVRTSPEWFLRPELQTYLQADRDMAFTPGAPLHRFAYIESQKTLVWTAHHSGYDGWTVQYILDAVTKVYHGGSFQIPAPIPRFIRYLCETYQDKERYSKYWRDQLDGLSAIPFPTLPAANYRPRVSGILRRGVKTDGIQSQSNISTTNVLRAAWAATIARYTGTDEALLAVALSGRDAPVLDINSIAAPTITTVPVRIKIGRNQKVSDFLAGVETQSSDMIPYIHTGLHNIRAALSSLGAELDPGHLFVVQPSLGNDGERDGMELIGLKSHVVENPDFAGYGLVVECLVDSKCNHVDIEIRYDENCLSAPTAEALLSQFELTVLDFMTKPQDTLGGLETYNAVDRDLLRQLNRAPPKARLECVHHLIQASIERYTTKRGAAQGYEKPAVCSWDGDLTYAELARAATHLASYLVSQGVGPEVSVGLSFSKSKWMVVAILAILLADGVVVPLGVQQPINRLSTIAKDANLLFGLTDAEQAHRLQDVLPRSLVVDETTMADLPHPADAPLGGRARPDNACWVIYTSGSTGVPKGVLLTHQCLATSIGAHGPWFGYGESTRALQFASLTFDIAIQDICTTLAYGGCVCIPSEDERLNNLPKAIRSMNVNTLALTPTVASLLNPSEVPSVETLVFGGEPVRPAVVERWLGHAKMLNSYGPAECSINSSCSNPIGSVDDAGVVGFPLAGCFFVVDPQDYNRLQPIGTPGELLIEGPLLARGYLNNEEKTAQSFLMMPRFIKSLGLEGSARRMYRTGDLVRQDRTGSLTHLGRSDTQIKIRGQRVEPGEIESHIIRILSGTRYAYVDLIKARGNSQDSILLAAVAFDKGHPAAKPFANGKSGFDGLCEPSPNLLAELRVVREALLGLVPHYMVPSHILPLTTMPVNASGKLDRRATRSILEHLDEEVLAVFDCNPTPSEDRLPSPTERHLRSLWAAALGRPEETISIHNRFIQSGGDSVSAIRLVSAAQKSNLRFGVADLLKNPSLTSLAAIVDAQGDASEQASKHDPLPFELWHCRPEERVDPLVKLADQCNLHPADIEDVYPCTPLQEGLMAITSQQSGAYLSQRIFRLGEDINVLRLRESWEQLVSDFAILRTRIAYDEQAGSLQVVTRAGLEWIDNRGLSLPAYLEMDAATPVAYGTPLHRLALVGPETGSTSRSTGHFVWTAHHSGYDGWSMMHILDALARTYKGQKRAETITPVPRFVRYLQQEKEESGAAKFWKSELDTVELTRFPQSPSPSYQPQTNQIRKCRLVKSASVNKYAMPVVLRAAWAATIMSYTGNDEALLAIALSGRDSPVLGIENIVAPTITTVPVRIQSREQTVTKFLARLEQQSHQITKHAHIGLQNIQAAVGQNLDPGNLFVVQPKLEGEEKDPLAEIGLHSVNSNDVHFKGYALVVECSFDPSSGGVDVQMLFDDHVLSHAAADAMLSQFNHLFNQLLTADPALPMSKLDLLNPIDRKLLQTWSSAQMPERAMTCLHELVQKSCESSPAALAVDSWDGRLTFDELDRASNQLANYLRLDCGVGPETTVGLCLQKSVWAIIAILGILKAGAAVVPIGIQNPTTRIAAILQDSAPMTVLVDEARQTQLQSMDCHITLVDQALFHRFSTIAPDSSVSSSNSAWIVYTSGSTGTPKGVVLEHQALSHSILSHGAHFGANHDTRIFQFAAYTFDIAISDILMTLVFGGCVCVPSEEQRLSDVSKAIRELGANTLSLTPTVAMLIEPEEVPNVQKLIMAGEAMTSSVVAKWKGHAKIWNAYGPSESSIYTTINGPVTSEVEATVIGERVSDSMNLWVVNKHDRLVPIGSPGELLIEGPLLAREYLHNASMTETSFIIDPESIQQLGLSRGRRLYRTGDLVQQRRDGSLLYLGRGDSQIKIRGQRVEVADVESHILRLQKTIKHACVDLIHFTDDESGEKRLVAALESDMDDSTHGEAHTDGQSSQSLATIIQDLRAGLVQALPLYMVPNFFVPVAAIPINASGKMDRRATRKMLDGLSYHELQSFDRLSPDNERALTDVETTLREIWATVLGRPIQDIGVEDTFIQAGGDSVAAMQIVAQCRQRKLNVSVRDILQKQTIAAISSSVQTDTVDYGYLAKVSSAPWRLSPMQSLYATRIASAGLRVDGDHRYNQSACVELRRPIDPTRFAQAVDEIVARHAMLRARIQKSADGTWIQSVVPEVAGSYRFDHHLDVSLDNAGEVLHSAQSSLDLQQGPVFSLSLLQSPEGEQLVCAVAHHLFVDLVSWRIILQDLEKVLLQDHSLQPSPVSFSAWCEALTSKTKDQWSETAAQLPFSLPTTSWDYWGIEPGKYLRSHQTTIIEEIPEATMSLLFGPANASMQTEPIEILLAALVRSFSTVFHDREEPVVFNEGHGRETWDNTIDLSETVGWFTTMTPLYITAKDRDALEVLRDVRERRRSTPERGLPYFASRFLSDRESSQSDPMEVLFNYMGRFQQVEQADGLFHPSNRVSEMREVGDKVKMLSALEVTVGNRARRGEITVRYSKLARHQTQIKQWVKVYRETLENLASDLTSLGPTDSISNGTKGVTFPATDAQKTVLDTHIRHPEIDMTYFVLRGNGVLDLDRMKHACSELVASIESFHTAFHLGGGSWDQTILPSFRPDISIHRSNEQLDSWTRAFIAKGTLSSFIYGRPPIDIVITMMEHTSEHQILFRLSHAIYDGLSIPHIWSTLQDIYRDGFRQKVNSFSRYAADTARHQNRTAREYWSTLLKESAMTPVGRSTNDKDSRHAWRAESLDIQAVDLNKTLPKGISTASLLKAAWALVLAQKSDTHDAVFGEIVSGRAAVDASLTDVVGCCATAIPIRVRLQPTWTNLQLLRAVHAQQLESMPFETFGFGRVVEECSDWPAGTTATSFVNNSPPRASASQLVIGGTEYSVFMPEQSEHEYTYSDVRISWEQKGRTIEFSVVYAVDKVARETAERLCEDFHRQIARILEEPQGLIGL